MDQLRAMRVFSQVVAQGSFAGAARVLDMAPAVVTRSVADLEQHLGVRLMQRNSRRLALTEIGERYLQRARQVLADLDEADALASHASSTLSGTLHVICPPAFAVHQLARQLPRFHQRHPAVRLEISAPGPVAAAHDQHDVSILSIGREPMHGDFVTRPLACSTFVLCAAPDYLARKGVPRVPDDLPRHDGLLPAVSAVRRKLTLYRRQPGSVNGEPDSVTLPLPKPLLSTSQLELLHAGALAGLGLAGLPSFLAQQALRDGRLQLVLPEWRGLVLDLHVAMPTRRSVPARTRAFIDFLIDAFGGRPEDPWLADIDARRGAPARNS